MDTKRVVTYSRFVTLATILKQDSKVNQQPLLYEDDFNNNDINQLAKNISRITPTRISNFKKINDGNGQELKLHSHIMQAAQIMAIPSKNDYRNLLKVNLLHFIAKMALPKSPPKVLTILQIAESKKYQEFLQLLWSIRYLDVIVVEHERKDNETALAKILKSPVTNLQYYNQFNRK